MKHWLGLLAAGALVGCVQHAPLPNLASDVRTGQQVAVTLPQYGSGKPYSLAQDEGKVVLLDVWATWCEPCRDALPVYQDLQKQYAARGLKVETINIDEDPHQIDAFLKEVKLSLPILLDPGGNFAQGTLHVSRMPTTFILGRDGDIRYVHEGFAGEFVAKYQSEIESLLAE